MFINNGVYIYEDLRELYYELFMEIGIYVQDDQHMFDQDTRMPIKFNNKMIKASVAGEPVYVGMNEIVFNPAENYSLIEKLFGYYLDKCSKLEDYGESIKNYVAHFIEDDKDRARQRVVVRTTTHDICSNYYYNIYLAYIDCIFRIGGYAVDLSNFDAPKSNK